MLVAGEAYMGARRGRAHDPATARSWLERAAEAGIPGAMTRLGEMRARGLEGERDVGAAAGWYRRAAALGETLAMHHLAHAHYRGEGVRRDYREALRWLRAAAEGGFLYAVHELAEHYDAGLREGPTVILEPDVEEAAVWYRKAAEQGSLEAKGWLIYYERELRGRDRQAPVPPAREDRPWPRGRRRSSSLRRTRSWFPPAARRGRRRSPRTTARQ